jgi:F-type H+-transporting ATPase subunit delta
VSYESIARRYAQAVFELAKENGEQAAITKQMTALADVFAGSDELRSVLTNPLVDDAAREAILVDIAGRLACGEIATRTLRVLAQNRRLPALPDIARAISRLVDQDSRTLRATVTSAGPLDDGYLARLRAELEKATGHTIALTARTEPALIAGVVVQIGDRVIDGSVRAKLSRFRESLQTT